MKRIVSLLLIIVMCTVIVGCSGTSTSPADTTAAVTTASGSPNSSGASGNTAAVACPDLIPYVTDNNEYTLYQNVYKDQNSSVQYAGMGFTKKGVFTTIYDSYSNKARYYVWGYADNTKCCDWQWELVPSDTSNLPSNGSLITAKGMAKNDDAALDKYWLTNVTITVIEAYSGPECDYDMTTMSSTLARVEVQNMMGHPEVFEGKTLRLYGRIQSSVAPTKIQHPYYDGAWELPFTYSAGPVPAVGKYVLISGKFVAASVSIAADSLQLDP